MHIEHFNISAPLSLLKQERDFFCEVFDLIEGFRPNFSSNGYWLYSGNKALVHLTESNEHFPHEKQGCFDHIAFQVTGLSKLLGVLKKLSVEYTLDNLTEIGMSQVFFQSPSGVGLEANFLYES